MGKPERRQRSAQPAALRPASAAEVARLAGVSRSAVSRTFTDGASVSSATRAKVLSAAKKLNYHVNHLARGISKEESRPVCLLASNLRKPYHGLLLDALTNRLQASERVAMVINVTADPQSAEEALQRALNYRAAASVVMSGTPSRKMVEACVKTGQKVILVNRSDALEGVHHIRIDYEKAMHDAMHMFERAGCKRIGLAGSLKGTPSLVAREQFFFGAAEALGKTPMVCRSQGTDYEDGVAIAREMLAGSGRPDAVFCINDLVACGFIDTARKSFGLTIPDDLCVLGFDDIPQASWSAYDLTTFAQPFDAIAEQMEKILLGTDGDEGADPDGAGATGSENAKSRDAKSQSTIKLGATLKWRKSIRANG